LWPCGDYCCFNLITTPNKYPLPNMQDLANGLHDCTIFSKIDLEKGYHQITAAAEGLPKTAIIMPLALFTSFGLSNAAQTFQRMIDCTVDNLEAVFAYMDDSWVGSPDRQAHLIHLEHFSPPRPPMALPSPWKNVFLHFQPWKFLITQFQWRVWPPWPNILPQSILVPPSGYQAIEKIYRRIFIPISFMNVSAFWGSN
jgi:hypothetical protein